MDKLINDRKKQLLDMQQMLRMQDLLEEYDRQNLFLNRQVDSLLKQNLILKQQKSLISSVSSHQLANDSYAIRGSRNNLSAYDQSKSSSYQKRKSRYQYMYDQSEIRDIKANLKNQIKRDAIKNLNAKQITNIQQANIHIPSKINWSKLESNTGSQGHNTKQVKFQFERQTRFGINKPQTIQTSSGDKFTPVKKPQQSNYQVKYQVKQSQMSSANNNNSKSKSKSKSKQKLEVSLKARPSFGEVKPIQSTEAKTHSPRKKQQEKTEPIQQITVKQIQQGAEVFLEQSFGNKSAQRLQKKFTLLEADFTLGQSKQQIQQQKVQINESRFSNRFVPLSIESKHSQNQGEKKTHNELHEREFLGVPSNQNSQNVSRELSRDISIIMSKTQLEKPGPSIYSEPALRSQSKQKRNHSLNPSPKVQYNPAQITTTKVRPFGIQTQEVLPGPTAELRRNPSQKIKRKFIKIISSQKIPQQESPKK